MRAAASKRLLALFSLAHALTPASAFACATCFGKSDSALAQGMNMGILALLGVVFSVLSAVAGFFFFLRWKNAQVNARSSERELAQTIARS
jgi:hypothetical protein